MHPSRCGKGSLLHHSMCRKRNLLHHCMCGKRIFTVNIDRPFLQILPASGAGKSPKSLLRLNKLDYTRLWSWIPSSFDPNAMNHSWWDLGHAMTLFMQVCDFAAPATLHYCFINGKFVERLRLKQKVFPNLACCFGPNSGYLNF